MGELETARRIEGLRRELDELAASIGRDGSARLATTTARGPRRGFHRPIGITALLVTLVLPGVVLASHQFSDVPDSNTFHTSISNLKLAGITAGCGGGKYCPNDPVTRGQMAAFLGRGLGRAAMSIDGAPELGNTFGPVVSRTIRTPGSGFVLATVAATAFTNDATVCPCEVRIRLDENDPDGETSDTTQTTVPVYGATGNVNAHLSETYVFTVQGAGSHSFAAKMLANAGSFSVTATLTLLWVPFDENGMAVDLSG